MIGRARPVRLLVAAAVCAAIAGIPLSTSAATRTATTTGAGDASSLAISSSLPAPAADGAVVEGPTLTLITGDVVRRVALPSGEMSYTTQPPDGQTGQYGSYVDAAGDTHVIPATVQGLVGDQLDPRLFNVTALFRDGYDDRSRPELPLIIEHTAPLEPVAGLWYGVALASIDATAARLDRSEAGALGRQLAAGAASRTLPHGLARIWLDGRVRASIDESVPQIGAPEAWAAGYDGTGMRIAILDTGIDDAHPDVAGQVVAARDFTFSGTTDDVNGHGTYVASIAAGTGAASDGRFTGVAYGADLINAKVLDDSGYGEESAVIAGLEWAAERQDADVINISANGVPTDGTDPMSQAVDAVSAAEDVLVVVSAGNEYTLPERETIGTPASADAALAVGIVDKSDVVPDEFGVRGPRLDRFAIKPEIAAPGVAITAAVTDDSPFGDPVQDGYAESSGSSASAPHVAGAAALLRQANPELTWSAVRSVLVTSGVDLGASVFAQGGGRVDVPAALAQIVHAAEPTANLGVLEWPHDDGETSKDDVILTNSGPEPVVLDLTVAARDEDGSPAPDGLVVIDDDQLTLQPGASGSVTVTVDPAVGGTGLMSGSVVASIAGVEALHVPLGFEVEPESYNLTVELADRSGGTDYYGFLGVVELTEDLFSDVVTVESGVSTVVFRVPAGTYGLTFQSDQGFEPSVIVDVTEPEVVVDRDTTVRLDGRDAVEVSVRVPEPATEQLGGGMVVRRGSESDQSGYYLIHELGGPGFRLFAKPTEETHTGSLDFETAAILLGPERIYQLVFPEPDRVPVDLTYEVDAQDVARVDVALHADVPRHSYRAWLGVSGSIWFYLPMTIDLPSGAVQETWVHAGDDGGYFNMFENIEGFGINLLQYSDYGLAAGSSARQRWYAQPSRPGMPYEWPIASRGDEFVAELWLMDADGHFGFVDEGFEEPSVDKLDFSLWSDGELVVESDQLFLGTELPPEPATYELRLESARQADWWRMSTATSTMWRFDSAAPPPGEAGPIPLLQVDYDVALDALNRATAPATIAFTPHAPSFEPGDPAEEITGFESWTSIDDGATWTPLALKDLGDGSYEGVLAPAQTCAVPCFVSLKIAAESAVGTELEQTITRAVAVSPASTTPTLPPTGPGAGLPGLVGIALGLVLVGLLAVVLAARRRVGAADARVRVGGR